MQAGMDGQELLEFCFSSGVIYFMELSGSPDFSEQLSWFSGGPRCFKSSTDHHCRFGLLIHEQFQPGTVEIASVNHSSASLLALVNTEQ